jgi:hypothetical protein
MRIVRPAQSDAKSYQCKIGPVQTYIALVGVFSGLPPFLVQTSAEVDITQPLPLHEFCPMQPLLAVLHELWPLQLLPPMHFTLAALAGFAEELCARTGVLRNIAPTAAAKAAPVIVLRSIAMILLLPDKLERQF